MRLCRERKQVEDRLAEARAQLQRLKAEKEDLQNKRSEDGKKLEEFSN